MSTTTTVHEVIQKNEAIVGVEILSTENGRFHFLAHRYNRETDRYVASSSFGSIAEFSSKEARKGKTVIIFGLQEMMDEAA